MMNGNAICTITRNHKQGGRSMKERKFCHARIAVISLAFGLITLGLTSSEAAALEPIVGLWQASASYDDTPLWNVIMAWTSDGLEVEDYALPILEGHIC